jgi:inosine/xanthosine triphosphatase
MADYKVPGVDNHIARLIRISIGSTNPVKAKAAIDGATKAFKNRVEIEADMFNVASGVADQPFNDEETLTGAMNRARNAWEEYKNKHGHHPDYSFGMEGGVRSTTSHTHSHSHSHSSSDQPEELECFAWMVVYNGKQFGKARTGTFILPQAITNLMVNEKKELGDADDIVFKKINSKQGEGTVGSLTKGVIDRAAYYEHAVILAFIPFQWPELYPDQT